MRILVLHSMYRSGPVSGENRVVHDEVQLLTEAGHDVDVFAPEPGEPSGFGKVKAGIDAIWSRRSVDEVRRRVRDRRPDLVHCHNVYPALSPAVLRATDGTPIVATLHNYRFACLPASLFRDGRICEDCVGRLPWPGIVHRCYQGSTLASGVLASAFILHRSIGTTDRIRLHVAISDFVRDKHVEAGLPAERIVVKPHFVWPAEPRTGVGEYFMFMGRLAPEKGLASLLDAWKRVRAKLLVVGDGPEAGRLHRQAGPNVEFRGAVQPTEIPALLRGARALLVPSIWHEGAGRVVLESYAAGVPVVVSRVGGLPEIVEDGVSGLVMPPADTAAWAGAVERLGDDTESERMGRSALALWAERYSPGQGLLDIEKIYRSALA